MIDDRCWMLNCGKRIIIHHSKFSIYQGVRKYDYLPLTLALSHNGERDSSIERPSLDGRGLRGGCSNVILPMNSLVTFKML
jgi:hypothetical protein